jgi:hypothetical protein
MNKVFLSCAIVAGVMLAAGAAMADQCTAGGYTISTPGPVASGASTSITYTIAGPSAPDHVATVVASGSTDCFTTSITSVTGSNPASGNQKYGPAVGDPVTGLGKWACHEEAAKINPNGNVFNFSVTVSGTRSPAPKSVAVKKGSKISSCEIVGIGDPGVEPEVAPVTEIIKEPGSQCAVEFTLDRITGNVLHAEVTGDSSAGCKLNQTPVENLSLQVNGPFGTCADATCQLGNAKFGTGYVHSGTGSCTTRIIGGRVYSWGDPCPE